MHTWQVPLVAVCGLLVAASATLADYQYLTVDCYESPDKSGPPQIVWYDPEDGDSLALSLLELVDASYSQRTVEVICVGSRYSPGEDEQTLSGATDEGARYLSRLLNRWVGSGMPPPRPVWRACYGSGQEYVAVTCSCDQDTHCQAMAQGSGQADCTVDVTPDFPGAIKCQFGMEALSAGAAYLEAEQKTEFSGNISTDMQEVTCLNVVGSYSKAWSFKSTGEAQAQGGAMYEVCADTATGGSWTCNWDFVEHQQGDVQAGGSGSLKAGETILWTARSKVAVSVGQGGAPGPPPGG
jgi:hypothetical protein